MKTTWKIAKAELKSLFSSPIAWLILIIFAFQAGLTFAELIEKELRYIALEYRPYNLTGSLLLRYSGVFSAMQNNLYLYIPLLTMGLMSREFSSGSIKLLYSSPVTNRQIIIGKYISMLVYAAILTGILFIFFLFCMGTVKDFDWQHALTGLLGIYLLTCAYASIGLYMSTITAYQVVAAVGTLTTLAILNYVQNIGQNYDFIRDLTYWFSLADRSKGFLSGIICREDVLYFIIVVTLFLTLSIFKLKFDRATASWGSKILQYTGLFALTFMLGYVSSRPTLTAYYDATATKGNTLTIPSQEVMNQMDGGLKMTTYVNLFDENYNRGLPRSRNWDMNKFEQYVRFKPEMEIEYVYYYHKTYNPNLFSRYPNLSDEELAKRMCESYELNFNMFLSPEEIENLIDLSDEDWHFVRIIERENGQTARLRIYNDNQRDPKESEITAAMKQMVVKSPKVAFVTGHGERDIYKNGDREFGAFAINLSFRHALVNQGFSVMTLNLSEKDIPEEVDIVVIADAREAYTPEELARFNRFIDRGGNAIILSDVRHQEVMNPIVKNLGIRFEPGVVVCPTPNYQADMLFLKPTAEAIRVSPEYRIIPWYGYKLIFPGATAIRVTEDKGFQVTPMICTPSKGAWNELQTTDFIDDVPVLNPATEKEDSIPVVVRLNRQVGEKEQRIIVFGDADCIANGELTASRFDMRGSNFTMITESFRDLSYGVFPVDDSRPRPKDDALYIGQGALIWVQILFMGLVPGGLLLWYLLLWWNRRKK